MVNETMSTQTGQKRKRRFPVFACADLSEYWVSCPYHYL